MHANENDVLLIANMCASKKLMCLFSVFLALADVNECEKEPCKNGGICTDLVANYSCECPGEYMGRNCQYSKCCIFLLFSLLFYDQSCLALLFYDQPCLVYRTVGS